MKRIAAMLLLLSLLITPFTNVSAGLVIPESPKHVIIHVEKDAEDDGIQRTMAISNPEASLSGICATIEDAGYFHIFGTITSTETRYFWQDTRILKERLGITKIKIYINSPGGSGQDGLGLADLIISIQKEGFEVEAYATGMVASAAVPVLAACGKRVANEGCMFMVHQAKLFKYLSQESAADLKAQSRMMEILTNRYLNVLERRTSQPGNEWLKKMEKTTWFTAKEALEWGLIDEIR